MKNIIKVILFLIFFSPQSWAKADDIRDFEIEGMSIGDSALKYYSVSQIKSKKQNWYRGKKYSTSAIGNIQISYKSNDSDFILKSIDKSKILDISKCKKEVSTIVDDIKVLFSDRVKLKGPFKIKHWADKTNKSWFNQYKFRFQNNDYIFVECYNWTDKITSTKGWNDNLRVRIVSKEFLNFLNNE